jgi:hypothetical protein
MAARVTGWWRMRGIGLRLWRGRDGGWRMSDDIDPDGPLNTAEPVSVKRVGDKAKAKQRALDDAMAAMLEQQATRRWLWDVLTGAHIFASCFAADGLVMAMKEGERNLGLKILAQAMRVSPENYTIMVQEAQRE